jgi:diphosphomevalonate decarboxylase
MNKMDVIKRILGDRYLKLPEQKTATAFAPTNIALVKYWGKRDVQLNLPATSSLSISLADKGAETTLSIHQHSFDIVTLNGKQIDLTSSFARRLMDFLSLFRVETSFYLDINIQSNIPIAAGLASSACGFAAVVRALDRLFSWNLSSTELSILARLGSGSACRSLWNGFVEWHMGLRDDGMDSHGELINETWPELSVGLLIMQETEKAISSREAMQRTVITSPLYSQWPGKVTQDLMHIKKAISLRDFELLGKTAEFNAMTMHALMLSAWPPISYALPETVIAMHKIWRLRHEDLGLYFTQDAGPNLKLLFLEKDCETIREYFPTIEIIKPFS